MAIISSEHPFGNTDFAVVEYPMQGYTGKGGTMELNKTKYLDALQLKLIAACAMFIDHTMYTFYPYAYELRTIGRLAFPIFAFLVAVGYQKTRSLPMYMARMFIFALIAQIPYESMLGLPGFHPNVIFTLFLGLVAIHAVEKGNAAIGLIIPAALAVLSELLMSDHGAYGVLMVVALYFAGTNKIHRSLWIFILTVLFSLQYIYIGGLASPGWYIVLFYLFTIPLINLYNGKKGLDIGFTKWFFYIFYPAHIILLVVLKSII